MTDGIADERQPAQDDIGSDHRADRSDQDGGHQGPDEEGIAQRLEEELHASAAAVVVMALGARFVVMVGVV